MIKIFDNVLEEQYLGLLNFGLNFFSWQIHWSGNTSEPPFFNTPVQNQMEYTYLFDIFKKKIGLNLAIGFSDLPVPYINLYPYGSAGGWHIDDGKEEEKPSKVNLTILFFPQQWKKKYKGELLFKTGRKIEYKKNRLIAFSANLAHRSETHFNPYNRYTIAYKTRVIKSLIPHPGAST
tara:strand:+ start:494 stop:1027 length:534 start_codon:yes stop_codon:yes gene_type:complete